MRQAGEVTYADAHKERTNEGVIEFRSYSDMRRALDKLDGTDINGRKIRLVEDKPRRRRSYSGSRSRSGLQFFASSHLVFALMPVIIVLNVLGVCRSLELDALFYRSHSRRRSRSRSRRSSRSRSRSRSG